jgi:hypothetical protein
LCKFLHGNTTKVRRSYNASLLLTPANHNHSPPAAAAVVLLCYHQLLPVTTAAPKCCPQPLVQAMRNIHTCAIFPGRYHTKFSGDFPVELALEIKIIAIASIFTCCEGLVKTVTHIKKKTMHSYVPRSSWHRTSC